jgi:tetratricopeptide (TPR) repeat protein
MLGKIPVLILGVSLLALAANPKVADANAKVKAGKYEEAIAALEPLQKASPKDAEVTAALVNAHLKYGDYFMYNEQLPPRQKYRPALRQYRTVLKYEPGHKDASAKIKVIETIYKQMGMPVPE